MIVGRVFSKQLVLLAGIAVIMGGAPAALAQEELVRFAGELVEDQGGWTDEQFDGWIDQIVEGVNGRDKPENGRLDERLSLKLDWMEASCGIDLVQRKKLQLAGRHDIKRFLDELREMKREYRRIKSDPIQFGKMQTRLAEIQTSSAADLFGENSFLSKMMHTTLSPEQAAAYAKATEESNSFARRAAIARAVEYCDLAIGLNDDQRRRLTELFTAETRPLKRNESSEISLEFTIFMQVPKLSQKKLKAIFDEEQWVVMAALLKQLEQNIHDQALPGLTAVELRALWAELGNPP